MLVTRQIPALWNGVSQQPAPVRLSSQAQELTNAMVSVVDGARKRSPALHVKKLSATALGNAYLHTINRDTAERYIVVVAPTGIRVFDLDGNEKTVTAPLGWGYLALPTNGQARSVYVCMTVADYTFVLNKSAVVDMLAVGADKDPPADGYWWLNRPLEDAGSAMAAGTTNYINEYEDSDPWTPGGGSTTTSSPTTGTTYQNPAGTLVGTVQTLQDLPATPAIGDVYKIIGTNDSNFQSYYVVWSGSAWNETVLPGLKNLVDAETMPHALVRQADGTFVFGPFAWQPRRVGDYNSNPNPTFVGRSIRDMFFYRNRFGVTVDENVVLSRAGDFGNFYRLTVVDYLPDEVIDIAASETKVTKMEFAVPFQGSLMMFSDQTQFKLNHNEVLSGATVSLDVTTQYPMVPGVRPARSGADVYFASQGSGWGLLREYFVNSEGIVHDAADVTSHVPKYIRTSIHDLAAAPEFDSVFVLSTGAPSSIYAYKYYWQSETEKAQSAWNTWTFAAEDTILAAEALNGYLYTLVDRTDGAHLERIPLYYGAFPAGLTFQVYLDRRREITGIYEAAPDEAAGGVGLTTFVLPYEVPVDHRGDFRLVFGSAFTDNVGAHFEGDQLTWTSLTTFTVEGDWTAGPCVVGLRYTLRYVFSPQYPLNGNGEAIHTGRLQLKTFTVYHTDTAYYRAEVRPYGPGRGTLHTSEFTARFVSVDTLGALGAPAFHTGKHTFAVTSKASECEIALVNDSHLGCNWHAAEWEGFYHNRARA